MATGALKTTQGVNWENGSGTTYIHSNTQCDVLTPGNIVSRNHAHFLVYTSASNKYSSNT